MCATRDPNNVAREALLKPISLGKFENTGRGKTVMFEILPAAKVRQ